jgi:ArsR family transcriptional regulator
MQRIAKALSDQRRFELLSAIAAREETPCRTLVERFPISQATISHHLKELTTAGLVDVRQEGQARFYRLRQVVLCEYLETVRSRLGCEVRSEK